MNRIYTVFAPADASPWFLITVTPERQVFAVEPGTGEETPITRRDAAAWLRAAHTYHSVKPERTLA